MALSGMLKSDRGELGNSRGVKFCRDNTVGSQQSLNESELGLDGRSLDCSPLLLIPVGIDLEPLIFRASDWRFVDELPDKFPDRLVLVEPVREPRFGEFLALPRTAVASSAISVSSSKNVG